MATANKVLRIAAGEIGYNRYNDPKQGTKYGRWYANKTNSSYFGTNGVPYCAMFVSWVLAQAGQKCAGMPTASCITALNGARNAGIVRKNKKDAKPGDLVLFVWDNGSLPDHIGFVELNKGSYIQTIEGNTSSGKGGSQSNGGGVYRRTRNWSNVLAIVAVPYTRSNSSSGGSNSSSTSSTKKVVVDGKIGPASTKEWQKQLGCSVTDGVISGQGRWNKSSIPNLVIITWSGKGSVMINKLQQFLISEGYSVGSDGADGLIGKQTVLALQRWMREKCGYVKHAIDGVLGPTTACNVQNALNQKRFKK